MVAQCVCVRVGCVFSEWVGRLGILYYYIFNIMKFNYINCLWHPIAMYKNALVPTVQPWRLYSVYRRHCRSASSGARRARCKKVRTKMQKLGFELIF